MTIVSSVLRAHGSKGENATQAFPGMEQLERLINFCELHGVGDVLIELQLALHVSVAKLWDLQAWRPGDQPGRLSSVVQSVRALNGISVGE